MNDAIGSLGPVQLRPLIWLVLSVLAALLAWFGFRGYLNPSCFFTSRIPCTASALGGSHSVRDKHRNGHAPDPSGDGTDRACHPRTLS